MKIELIHPFGWKTAFLPSVVVQEVMVAIRIVNTWRIEISGHDQGTPNYFRLGAMPPQIEDVRVIARQELLIWRIVARAIHRMQHDIFAACLQCADRLPVEQG